jgi:glc operon protein GlcG
VRNVPTIDMAEARRILDEGLRRAAGDGGKPVVVAVADAHGDLVMLGRMDGAPVRSIRIAVNKAYTAARALTTTEELAGRLKEAGRDVLVYGDPSFTLFPGGAPIKAQEAVIGAVGISGRTAEEDQTLADQLAGLLEQAGRPAS